MMKEAIKIKSKKNNDATITFLKNEQEKMKKLREEHETKSCLITKETVFNLFTGVIAGFFILLFTTQLITGLSALAWSISTKIQNIVVFNFFFGLLVFATLFFYFFILKPSYEKEFIHENSLTDEYLDYCKRKMKEPFNKK